MRTIPLRPPVLAAGTIAALLACQPVAAGPPAPPEPLARAPGAVDLDLGSGSFVFDRTEGTADRPVTVWYHHPAGIGSDAPIVFVMHGTLRNGEDYRDQWVELAEEHGFLLAVPEFSREHWPGAAGYNLGNMFDAQGRQNPEELWAFAQIEPIFDEVRRRTGSERETFTLYGHSAGAQFVHRMILFQPQAPFDVAIPANAGWYTMPTFDRGFPYGLAAEDAAWQRGNRDRLRNALQAPVIVLLGDRDTNPEASSLRRDPESLEQGVHRLERGLAYYLAGERAAREGGLDFGWRLVIVHDVGHSNTRMAPAAVEALGW